MKHAIRANGHAQSKDSLDVNCILIVALLVLYASFRTLIKYRIWEHEPLGLEYHTCSTRFIHMRIVASYDKFKRQQISLRCL